MARAVILGCSHAAGSEMDEDPELAADQSTVDFGYQHSYPVLVAQGLGYTAENRSISGGSNDAVFRLFTEQLAGLTSADIVIACWTGYNRTEIWHESEHLWLQLSPGRLGFNRVTPDDQALSGWDSGFPVEDHSLYVDYQQQWSLLNTGIELGRLNKTKNILALNTLAHAQGIRVINIDSFAPVTDAAWPSVVTWVYDQPFTDWAKNLQYPCAKHGHYFFAAHRAYADLILDSISLGFIGQPSLEIDPK